MVANSKIAQSAKEIDSSASKLNSIHLNHSRSAARSDNPAWGPGVWHEALVSIVKCVKLSNCILSPHTPSTFVLVDDIDELLASWLLSSPIAGWNTN